MKGLVWALKAKSHYFWGFFCTGPPLKFIPDQLKSPASLLTFIYDRNIGRSGLSWHDSSCHQLVSALFIVTDKSTSLDNVISLEYILGDIGYLFIVFCIDFF